MLSLAICRLGVFRKKVGFAELTTTIDLHIGIGHNKTFRKKRNPKSSLKAGSWKFPLCHSFLDVVANESKGVGALSIVLSRKADCDVG